MTDLSNTTNLLDPNQDLELPTVSDQDFTIRSTLKAIEQNPVSLGAATKDITAARINTKAHNDSKQTITKEFFEALTNHPRPNHKLTLYHTQPFLGRFVVDASH